MIFDERDLPWTIRLSLGWTVILALTSVGLLFIPLGLYLAYWVRTRRGRSAAFWCYVAVTLISILLLVPELFSERSAVVVTGIDVVLFLAAPHVLRAEIISLYQRSWQINLPISHLLTFLFSSVYLNYSIPDLPVALFDAISPQGAGPFRNSSG